MIRIKTPKEIAKEANNIDYKLRHNQSMLKFIIWWNNNIKGFFINFKH